MCSVEIRKGNKVDEAHLTLVLLIKRTMTTMMWVMILTIIMIISTTATADATSLLMIKEMMIKQQ